MKRTWKRAAVAALTGAVCLLGAACGGDGTDAGATDDAGAPSAEPTKSLTGRADAIFWSATDEKTVEPLDTRKLFVEALTPNADGSWASHPGPVRADGSYEIDGVPTSTGDYWFRLFDGVEHRDLYLWTNGEGPDLSREFRGRAHQAISKDRSTAVELNLSNFDPWQDGDQLDMTVANAGYTRIAAPTYASSLPPNPGETEIDGTRLPWDGQPLYSAAAGDEAIVTQIRQLTDATHGFTYSAAMRSAVLSPAEVKDGQTTVETGAFTKSPELDYPLEWKRAAFAALRGDVGVHGGDTPDTYLFFVHASPGGLAHGRLLNYELRLIDGGYIAAGESDLSFTIPTHNPYPRSWLVNGFTAQFEVPEKFEQGDLTVEGPVSAEIGVVTTELPSKESPAAPLVGPPRSITIGGQSTQDNLTGVGLDPEIAWTAPSLGTPTSWELHLQATHLEREFGALPHSRLVFDDVATLLVPGDVTHVRLPPHLLVEGVQYLVSIRAVMKAGQDVRRAPFRESVPHAWADAFTAYFAP